MKSLEEQLFQAIFDQNIEKMRQLVSCGVNPNAANKCGETALREAGAMTWTETKGQNFTIT